MEALVLELIKSLAAQGSAYTLLVIVGCGAGYFLNRWIKTEAKCVELTTAQTEKRLTERSETIAVLHAGTQANQKLADSMSVRTEAFNNLIVVVTTGNERMERLLSEMLRRLEERHAQSAELLRRLEEHRRDGSH